MKRKCNDIDIRDFGFIKNAIEDCMANKCKKLGKRVYERSDIKSYFKIHNNNVDEIVAELQNEIANRCIELKPVWYKKVVDKSNGKERELCIEHIKQQMYDYIAYNALKPLTPYIGVNQTACKIGGGQQYSAKLVYGWLQDNKTRYVVHADIKKCYPSIKREYMMEWLKRHVKNDDLLWLINELLKTCDKGLAIGSILSIRLCAFYVADLYHHVEHSYFYYRRNHRVNSVSHILIYLDDIYVFSGNAKELRKVINGTIKYAEGKGLTIKPDWKIISLNPKDSNAHIDVVGYNVYKNRITSRRKNYLSLKKSLKQFKKKPYDLICARRVIATSGMVINHTNSYKLCKKYNIYDAKRNARKVVSQYDKSKIC